ncbi:hypothetical protein D3C77_303760 [compost metagenome]
MHRPPHTQALRIQAPAQAAPYAVAPGPYLAAWHQDTHGRMLDVCLSNSTTVVPTSAPTATISSSQGTVRTVPVTVQ